MEGSARCKYSPSKTLIKITDGKGQATYDHVSQEGPEKDPHLYAEVTPMILPTNDTEGRLESIEKQHNRLLEDFNQFKTDIASQIASLKEINTTLMTLVMDSSQKLQDSMDRLLLKFSENSDHLGQQILEVRREIVTAARKQHPNPTQVLVHSFEWEVTNVDHFSKSQKEFSSHCYLIPHLDYKTHGSVVGHKDGRMRLKLVGEFGHSFSRNSLQRNTKFECTAHVLDKSEKLQELIVGRAVGDFNGGNEWYLGELSTSDLKKRGYVTKGGNISLKFTIEISG
ncbi:unnamed protein product [Candidula unifasciata]|uniref:Uncharacterized protein n=1 Tax=Candidula unifasciata TaxID=100452 RepID=A0A8S3ZQ51_9EUPU|nr:unnamed protein product [Candidula unifasciata]